MHWYACINVSSLDGLALALNCEHMGLAGKVPDE